MTTYRIADLDGTDDAAAWLTPGHVLSAQEVEWLRNLLITEEPAELTLRTQRTADAEEIESLVTGTSAMSWPWWGGWAPKTVDGVDGWEFKHDNADSEEGAWDVTTWVSNQEILDAAGRFIAEGRLRYDVADVMTESIGYLDASDADVVLQYAVLGEIVFG